MNFIVLAKPVSHIIESHQFSLKSIADGSELLRERHRSFHTDGWVESCTFSSRLRAPRSGPASLIIFDIKWLDVRWLHPGHQVASQSLSFDDHLLPLSPREAFRTLAETNGGSESAWCLVVVHPVTGL